MCGTKCGSGAVWVISFAKGQVWHVWIRRCVDPALFGSGAVWWHQVWNGCKLCEGPEQKGEGQTEMILPAMVGRDAE